VTQPVAWDPIGESFYIFRTTTTSIIQGRVDFGVPRRVTQPRRVLARVHVPEMSIESLGPIVRPAPRDMARESGIIGWSLVPDEKNDRFFFSALSEASPPQFDAVALSSIGVGSPDALSLSLAGLSLVGPGGLSLSPDGRKLAYRFGPDDVFAPVAVLDVASGRSRTLAPTMSARMRGLRILTTAIAQGLARPDRGPTPLVRPHRRPWDASTYAEAGVRSKFPLALFRLPSIKGPPPAEVSPAVRSMIDEVRSLVSEAPLEDLTPTLRRQLAEVELFTEYVAGQYEEAMRAADRLVQHAAGSLSLQEKHLLHLVRIQCLAALGRQASVRWEMGILATALESQQAEETQTAREPDAHWKKTREEILNRLFAIETSQPAAPTSTPSTPNS
jgi:hypothetical protein